jgi:hypothetical protein
MLKGVRERVNNGEIWFMELCLSRLNYPQNRFSHIRHYIRYDAKMNPRQSREQQVPVKMFSYQLYFNEKQQTVR